MGTENEKGGAVQDEGLMTPAEVAKRFKVDPKTVARWANEGRFTSFRTLGGHRRFKASEIEAFINSTKEAQQNDV